jgi:quercetin dioxygenase-like cupin family protein
MRIDKSFFVGFMCAVAVLTAAASSWSLMTAYAQQTQPAARRHVFVKRAEAEVLKPPNGESRIMLTASQTGGRHSIVDEVFKAGTRSFPHQHTYHAETFLTLKGQMEWTVGGETQTIGPGDLVYIPPHTTHAVKVAGKEDVHAIMIYEPGGYELNLRRRLSMTPEQMNDPKTMRMMMELSDVVPSGGTRPPNQYARGLRGLGQSSLYQGLAVSLQIA